METQDRARLKSFMRCHLLPFFFVVLIYAILENWWIYYKPGGQIMKPYFGVFIYNVLLVLSFVYLSSKKSMARDLLNMALSYFCLFAVEIFNTARLTKFINRLILSPTGVDFQIEYEIGNPEYRMGIFIVGWVFFFYAVHTRSKLLDIHRINQKEANTLPENSKSKLGCSRTHLIIFVISFVAKTCFEVFWIYYKIGKYDCLPTPYVVVYNNLLLISTGLFYRYRNIACNLINMIIAYSSIIVLQQVNLVLGAKITNDGYTIGSTSVAALDNCILFIVGGLYFVWTIYTRTMLLEDCDYSASARRLVDYIKLKLVSAKQSSQPTLVSVDKEKNCEKGLEQLPPKYESL